VTCRLLEVRQPAHRLGGDVTLRRAAGVEHSFITPLTSARPVWQPLGVTAT